MTPNILTGRTAWQEAQKRARFGHKEWIAWVENETLHAARLTTETLKRAMLSEGTQCRLINYGASAGAFIVSWSIACNMLRQLKRGWR